MRNGLLLLFLGVLTCTSAVGCGDRRIEAMGRLKDELADRAARRSRSMRLYARAMQAYEAEDWPSAQKLLNDAIGQDDRNAHAWMALGMLEFRQDRSHEAARAFHRSARLQPDRFEPQYNLGIVFESAGHYARAVEHYEAALKLSPDQVEVMENLAGCYIGTNTRSDRAKELVDRALESESRPEWVQWLAKQAATLKRPDEPRPTIAGAKDASQDGARVDPAIPDPDRQENADNGDAH